MRKLLALLLLLVTPAVHAQQVDWYDAVNVPNVVVNPSMNDCPSNVQAPTCGAWKTAPGPGDWTNQFGSTEYVFSYVDGRLFQDIDLSDYQTKAFNFYFDFDLNNSCRNSIFGWCGNVDGPIDFISAKVKFYDQNGLNNEFTFLNGNVSTARVECDFSIFGLCLGGYTAYDNWQHFGWYSSVQSDSLFTSAQIEFTGRDVGFWGGLYGPRVDNPTLQINYIPPPYPTVGGDPGMNVSAPGSDYIFIYKGNDPVLFSQLAIKGDNLIGWTAVTPSGENLMVTDVERVGPDYLFLHTDGAPASGSWYSFQQQAPAVDCARSPSNTACIISAVNTTSTDSTTTASTETPSTTSGTIDVSPTPSATTEIVANTGSTSVESFAAQEKVASDPVLVASVASEAVASTVAAAATNPLTASSGTQAAYRELTDEEKAAILADAISKNVIENALTTIAATSAASSTNGSQDGSSSGTTTVAKTTTAETTSENTGMFIDNNQQTTQTDTQENNFGMDALDTGRTIGQQALTTILATSADFADQAGQQAESIAQNSAVATQTQFDFTVKDTSQETYQIDVPVFSQSQETIEQNVMEVITAAVDNASMGIESVVADDGRPKEIPGLSDSMAIEQQTLAVLDVIRQSAEPVFEDDSKQFEEAIVNNNFDPQAAAAFGAAPSVANLEILGVIKPVEEKSDAEKRAEEVVAANQQQMEDINKNYMEADQSGIVAAIGADTDVSSYRKAMLADAAQWYKDKDIYKGILIKDNVRGSYFLEKGNTDTFKKMVDEQYK